MGALSSEGRVPKAKLLIQRVCDMLTSVNIGGLVSKKSITIYIPTSNVGDAFLPLHLQGLYHSSTFAHLMGGLRNGM